MKRIKQLLILGLCLLGLTGCGGEQQETMSLSVSVGDTPAFLDPIYAGTVGDQSIVAGLYENLMRVTTDAQGNRSVVGGMAKSVDHEAGFDGAVTYTFKLHKAKWSDGQPVTAGDFVYAWRRLADPASNSPYASLLSVVAGYDEARESGDLSLLQVTAENDTTLKVVLDGHYDWFLTDVCTSPATMPLRRDVVEKLQAAHMEDTSPWWVDPTALVTNGPYVVESYDPESELLAVTNEQYDDAGKSPAQVHFVFASGREEAWKLYEEEAVDVVWPLPQEQLQKMVEDKGWIPQPLLSTYSLLFNYHRDELADPLVRRAMNLSLNRNTLAEAQRLAAPAGGLVPPGVPGNEEGDFRSMNDPLVENDPEKYQENCTVAKELLEESGHAGGSGMETLEYLYINEGSNAETARLMARMWKDVLGISVTPKGVSESEFWSLLSAGDFQLAGMELSALGNDAECFLMRWTSDHPGNVIGYENSAYDTLMNVIATASSEMARMGCLHDAEELLLSDDVIAPLYNGAAGWAMNDSLTGLVRDPRGWFSFRDVGPRGA